jgi:Methylmalonyl-CoA mutase, C-terminal domain/subunit (cobalamin-binding)
VIVPEEISELERYGVEKIYSPQDGQRLGLQGMIDDMIARCAEGARAAEAVGQSPVGEWVDEFSKRGLPRFDSRGDAGGGGWRGRGCRAKSV